MQKRGQITVFILIGLVILIAVVTTYFIIGLGVSAKNPVEFSPESLEQYVTSCLTVTAQRGLELLGKQGGHIFLQEPFFAPLSTSFLYYKGDNRVPSLAEMENELARYIEGNIASCLGGFAPFTDKGWSVLPEEPKVFAAITELDVTFQLQMQITLERNGERVVVDKFFKTEDLRLKKIWTLVNAMVQSEVDTKGMIDLDIVMETYPIVFFPYQQVLIGRLTDTSYQFTERGEYVFLFANTR